MADPQTFRARITYCKLGRLAYLSHLEITRALERAVRRADLPFCVSQGFSPHMKISFGPALPVGVGGTEEVFDLYLSRYIAPAKILAALQEVTPEDLKPYRCEYVEPRDPAASDSFVYSLYAAELSDRLFDLEIPEEVTVTRKKGTKTLQVADYLCGDMVQDDNERGLRFVLQSHRTGSLKPDLLLKSFLPANCEILNLTRVGLSQMPLNPVE